MYYAFRILNSVPVGLRANITRLTSSTISYYCHAFIMWSPTISEVTESAV